MAGRAARREKVFEDGSRDYRLVPAAIMLWATLLITEFFRGNAVDGSVLGERMFGASGIGNVVLGALPCVLLCALLAAFFLAIFLRWYPRGRNIACHCVVVIAVAFVGFGVSSLNAARLSRSAVYQSAQSQGSVHVVGTVSTAPIASWRMGFDCQFSLATTIVGSRSVVSSDSMDVLAFAKGQGCAVENGTEYRIDGRASVAEFGNQPVWLDVEESPSSSGSSSGGGVALRRLAQPSGILAVFSQMRDGFVRTTQRLDQQARVLVPGLTIGVVGQDLSVSESTSQMFAGLTAQSSPDDEAFGTRLEQQFKNAGIIHLMAVSGGHFVLAAIIAKRIGGLLRLRRVPRAVLAASAIIVLMCIVYPSDSVARAVVTGAIGISALVIGRRPQPMSALSLCIMLVLLIEPSMASSYGFALSCAAVVGIVCIGSPLARWIQRRIPALPSVLVEGFALSFGAQFATLPIQIAMSAQVPMLSIVANLIVAPFVTAATVLGLLSFLLSWIVPPVGFALAWLSGIGTYVMYVTARFFGAPSFSFSVDGDALSAALVCVVIEVGVVIAALLVKRFVACFSVNV